MINRKARKSSRKAMAARNNKPKGKSPSVLFVKNEIVPMNRAAKRIQASTLAHAGGFSSIQAQRQKRKDKQKAARVELRQIRKETRKAMGL